MNANNSGTGRITYRLYRIRIETRNNSSKGEEEERVKRSIKRRKVDVPAEAAEVHFACQVIRSISI